MTPEVYKGNLLWCYRGILPACKSLVPPIHFQPLEGILVSGSFPLMALLCENEMLGPAGGIFPSQGTQVTNIHG